MTIPALCIVSNDAPTADAGADQSVVTGSTVTLDGSASSDVNGDTLTYSWTIISKPSGSSAALSDANVVNPMFTADVDGNYVFSLVVNDGTVDSTVDTVTITAVNMLINDNFDSDTVGTLPPDWHIKYNGTGTANQKVVDTIYVSPNHSFQLEGAGGWAANIYKTPSAIPSQVAVEANINIGASVSGWSGWFALYNKDVGTWGTQVGGLQFKDGKFYAYYAGGHYYTIQDFTVHQWYHVKIEYNIAAKTYQVYIDGVLVTGVYNGVSYTTFPMHPSVSPAQLMLTAGNGGAVKVFYDDVKMY